MTQTFIFTLLAAIT